MVFSYSILSIFVIFCTSCLCRKSFGRSGPETLTILDSNITWKGWSRGDLDSFFYYKNYDELKESLPSDVPFLVDFDWTSASSTYGAIWAVFNTENGTRISTLNFDPNQNHNGQNTEHSKSPKIIDFLTLSIYLHDKSYIFPYKGPRTSNEVIRKISHEDTELQKFYNISIPIGAPSFTLEFGVSSTSLIYIDKMTVVFKSKVKPTTTPSRVYTIGTTPYTRHQESGTSGVEITQQQPKSTTIIQTKPSSISTLPSTLTTADRDRDLYKLYMVDPTFVKKDPAEPTGTSRSSINTSSKSETEEKPLYEEDTSSTTLVKTKTTEISAGTSVESEAEQTSSSIEISSSISTTSNRDTPSDKMAKIIDDSNSSSTSGLNTDSSTSYSTVNNNVTSISNTSTTDTTSSSTTSNPEITEITTTNVNKKTSKNNNKNTGSQIYLSFTCLFVFTILIIMR